MSDVQQRIDDLLKPMLKMRLYVAINSVLKTAKELLPWVPAHLEYMIALEQQGVLFASGPFIEPGVVVAMGLTIIRAPDITKAREYLDNEPLVKQGLRRYDLYEWELREGRVNFELDFSTGKYQVA